MVWRSAGSKGWQRPSAKVNEIEQSEFAGTTLIRPHLNKGREIEGRSWKSRQAWFWQQQLSVLRLAMQFERRFRNIAVPKLDAVAKASETKDLSSS
jgi:hypothetical protein